MEGDRGANRYLGTQVNNWLSDGLITRLNLGHPDLRKTATIDSSHLQSIW